MRKKTHEEYELELLNKGISYRVIERYSGARTNILHQCPQGHTWKASPDKILHGRGCIICNSIKQSMSRSKSHEQYEQELISKGIVYKPLEAYKNRQTSILHECPEGHQWETKPHNILHGHGCPICATHGFNPKKPAILYFFSFTFNDLTYYKIGITSRTVQKRHSLENWDNIKVLWEVQFELGSEARKAEREILIENKDFLVNTGALKTGNTETFSIFINPPNLNLDENNS